MNLLLLPQDKANHVVYGALVAAVVSLFSISLALLAVVLVGVGKEAYDWWRNMHGEQHGVEVMDAVATVCGGLIVLVPQVINKLI